MNFVCNQAKMRTDPSFMLTALNNDSTEHHRQVLRTDGHKPHAVLKTGVSPKILPGLLRGSAQTSILSASRPVSTDDPAKHCVLHNKPHPLSKC